MSENKPVSEQEKKILRSIRQKVAQPSPRTDRPDVEEIQAEWESIQYCDYAPQAREEKIRVAVHIPSLCDYALDVEKRLEAAEKRIKRWTKACGERYDWAKKADSLLADLVEQVEAHRAALKGVPGAPSASFAYDCVASALVAAKQHRESGEKGKKK